MMTIDTIHEHYNHHRGQAVTYQKLIVLDGRTIRIDVKDDGYPNQSYVSVDAWTDGKGWVDIYTEVGTVEGLTKQNGTVVLEENRIVFDDIVDDLTRIAHGVLFPEKG